MTARMRFDPLTGRERSQAFQAVIRDRLRDALKAARVKKRVQIRVPREFSDCQFVDERLLADLHADDVEAVARDMRDEDAGE